MEHHTVMLNYYVRNLCIESGCCMQSHASYLEVCFFMVTNL